MKYQVLIAFDPYIPVEYIHSHMHFPNNTQSRMDQGKSHSPNFNPIDTTYQPLNKPLLDLRFQSTI